jgi:hypothetical protein
MLWNTGVADLSEPTDDGMAAMKLLGRTEHAGGGTNLLRPLEQCHQILDRFKGKDRVVAIFGDGDLGPRQLVLTKVAQMKAEDIRFVTRGLGGVAAREFAEVSSEDEPGGGSRRRRQSLRGHRRDGDKPQIEAPPRLARARSPGAAAGAHLLAARRPGSATPVR